VRSIFTKELIDFFEQMVRPDGNWPGIKNDDLIAGIVEAVQNTAKKIPDGMGIGLMHSLAYTALDAAHASISDEPKSVNQAKLDSKQVGNQPVSASSESHYLDFGSDGNGVEEKAMQRGAEDLEAVSPLRAMGYTVAEGSLTERQRRNILRKAITQETLDLEDTAQSDHRWGCGHTSDRLKAIASYLFWLARFQGAEKPGAKERWLSDIDWLKKSYSDLAAGINWKSFGAENLASSRRVPYAAFMAPLNPSPPLAAIVGREPISRVEVTKKIWEYIKRNRLQDGVTKRIINADKKLLKIFGKSQVSMFEMAKLVNDHLKF
jgi:hypothetical protein